MASLCVWWCVFWISFWYHRALILKKFLFGEIWLNCSFKPGTMKNSLTWEWQYSINENRKKSSDMHGRSHFLQTIGEIDWYLFISLFFFPFCLSFFDSIFLFYCFHSLLFLFFPGFLLFISWFILPHCFFPFLSLCIYSLLFLIRLSFIINLSIGRVSYFLYCWLLSNRFLLSL